MGRVINRIMLHSNTHVPDCLNLKSEVAVDSRWIGEGLVSSRSHDCRQRD